MIGALFVGIGGFIGAVARYALGFLPCQQDFPLITLSINFFGSMLIGVVAELARGENAPLPPSAVLLLKTGFCGGFTTFSTFSLETLSLLESGRYLAGGAYAAGSVVLCVAGVAVGQIAARAAMAHVSGA